jgi:hypothetical protein
MTPALPVLATTSAFAILAKRQNETPLFHRADSKAYKDPVRDFALRPLSPAAGCATYFADCPI